MKLNYFWYLHSNAYKNRFKYSFPKIYFLILDNQLHMANKQSFILKQTNSPTLNL